MEHANAAQDRRYGNLGGNAAQAGNEPRPTPEGEVVVLGALDSVDRLHHQAARLEEFANRLLGGPPVSIGGKVEANAPPTSLPGHVHGKMIVAVRGCGELEKRLEDVLQRLQSFA